MTALENDPLTFIFGAALALLLLGLVAAVSLLAWVRLAQRAAGWRASRAAGPSWAGPAAVTRELPTATGGVGGFRAVRSHRRRP